DLFLDTRPPRCLSPTLASLAGLNRSAEESESNGEEEPGGQRHARDGWSVRRTDRLGSRTSPRHRFAPLSSPRPCLAGVRQTTMAATSATRPTPTHLHHPEGLRRDSQGAVLGDAFSSSTPRYAVVPKLSKTPATGGGRALDPRSVFALSFLSDWSWTGERLVVVVLAFAVVRRRPPGSHSPFRLFGIPPLRTRRPQAPRSSLAPSPPQTLIFPPAPQLVGV
ncbi:hypothetical protein FB451DRAFT_1222249, partial [Mycena latifolia]